MANCFKTFPLYLLAAISYSQQPSSLDKTDLLTQAVQRIRQNSATLPNITCLETVRRSYYTAHDRKLAWSDQYRLVVGLFQGRELFSWPDAAEFRYERGSQAAPGSPGALNAGPPRRALPVFTDEWPDALIGDGASTAGEFGPFAINVFLADAGLESFRFERSSEVANTHFANYSYQVPYDKSHFLVKAGLSKPSITAFEGSILIDLHSADLKRLTVNIPKPPKASGLQNGKLVTDYDRVEVGKTFVLLPLTSTTTLTTDSGDLSVNESLYSSCHEFTAESSVNFKDSHEPSTVAAPSPALPPPLPPGLKFLARFTTPIDSGKSFAGDPVDMEVVNNVKMDGQTMIPAHAHLHGRIVSLRRQFEVRRYVVLAIEFDYLEINGSHIPVSVAALGPPVMDQFDSKPPALAAEDSMGRHVARIILYDTDHLHFSKRTRWYWQTLPLTGEPPMNRHRPARAAHLR